ncbi:MAG: aminotransferase class I/II-fold pyridoxal phosphate-dependent enzyme, partial [Propionibacteriaceae bacterium]|nr:aminotransferase class I/II-fold pyridoxal phosphate-dependent enzyme [Propionibacteriaceae bacterium]
MRISNRLPRSADNEIARLRAELAGSLTDLTDTNPTRHGLSHPRIAEIMARAARDGSEYQPHPRGLRSAREALAGRFGGHPDDFWLTASTSEAYGWLFALLADPGQQVAIPAPGYPLIAPLARLAAVGTRSYRTFYLHPHGWEYDLDSLSSAVAQPQTRALVVVNPNNPTGGYADRAAASAIADCCQLNDVALICDEVFFESGASGCAGVRMGGPGSFSLHGLSKLLAAPQLKLAWIQAPGLPPDLAAGLDQIADSYLSANAIVQQALPELLTLADEVTATLRTRLERNYSALQAAFEAGELHRDVVAVVRFQGPNANGMPELHRLTPPLGV